VAPSTTGLASEPLANFSLALTLSEQSTARFALKGESISPRVRSQLLTEEFRSGNSSASDEQPIILFVDQQTTGGYPKIANVISADFSSLGQLRPREQVRFIEVTIPEAIHLLREREEWLKQVFQC
jgi:antagonist of KipI